MVEHTDRLCAPVEAPPGLRSVVNRVWSWVSGSSPQESLNECTGKEGVSVGLAAGDKDRMVKVVLWK